MKVTQLKLLVSVVFVAAGLALGVYFVQSPDSDGEGVMTLDFGDYEVETMTVDDEINANEALVSMCGELGYDIVFDGDGNVQTINGYPKAGDSRTWGVYTLNSSYSWVKYTEDSSTLTVNSGDRISWALCSSSGKPTPCVDMTGTSFYGYGTAKRIVCLAPSCTETVCALGGEEAIVGVDLYSNYPTSIIQKENAGLITVVGTYTTPSFETIVELEPDLVIGISSQFMHVKTVEQLREVGINGIVVSDGEDLQSVYDNTYMTGIAMGYDDAAKSITLKLKEQVEQTHAIINATSGRPTVMTALSSEKSPWVAGTNTYVSDCYSKAGAKNAFEGSVDGWKQISAEEVIKINPDIIIVISQAKATESNYESMLANLSAEWKATTAYKNGDIYMVSGMSEDLYSRPSTRLAQLTEILGRMFHEDAFPSVIEVPMYYSDNYTDYLTYSKEL